MMDASLDTENDPTEQEDTTQEPPLQMHSLQTTAQIDATLNQLADHLDSTISNGKVEFQPRLAVINLPTDESSSTKDTNQAATTDAQHNTATPLHVDDYSVYGEQVNC